MAIPHSQLNGQIEPKYGTLIPNRVFVGGIRYDNI